MNQIDMIDIQRRAIQIVDIKRQPRRIKNNYREETMSAVTTVVAMGLVVVLGIATWVSSDIKKECHDKGGNLQALGYKTNLIITFQRGESNVIRKNSRNRCF